MRDTKYFIHSYHPTRAAADFSLDLVGIFSIRDGGDGCDGDAVCLKQQAQKARHRVMG